MIVQVSRACCSTLSLFVLIYMWFYNCCFSILILNLLLNNLTLTLFVRPNNDIKLTKRTPVFIIIKCTLLFSSDFDYSSISSFSIVCVVWTRNVILFSKQTCHWIANMHFWQQLVLPVLSKKKKKHTIYCLYRSWDNLKYHFN